jgi:hypothetical protein
MVMMKIDRPELKLPRCMPMPQPLPQPLPLPGTPTVDDATFDLIDGDGNGKLSTDEWKGAGWTADRQAAFDTNGNGEITRDEFRQGRRFEREFNAKDFNGDGQLSRTEFLGRIFHRLGENPMLAKLPGVKAALGAGAKAIASLDAMFPPSKHLVPIKDRFTTFDADRDGQVTKAEYIKGRRNESILNPTPIGPVTPIFPHPSHKLPPSSDPLRKEVLVDVSAKQEL